MTAARKLLILIGLCVLLAGLLVRFVSSGERAARRAALAERLVVARALAEHLAQAFPGQKALVIGNPFTREKGRPAQVYDFEEAGIRGLKEGFGSAVTLAGVEYPRIKEAYLRDPASAPIDPSCTTPLSYLIREDAFDQAAAAHPECRLIVSLIGVPADISAVRFWMKQDAPAVALLLPELRMIGGADAVPDAFASGQLAAAVLAKPQPGPGRGFEDKYLLVTPDNVEELVRKYPSLF